MTFLIIDYTTDLKIIRVKGLHCPYYYWQVYQDYELRKKSKYSLPRAKHLFSHHELFCFCDMLDRRKVLSLISYLEWCQRSSPSQISCTLQKEPGFRFIWMKLCNSDNHYTTSPLSEESYTVTSKILLHENYLLLFQYSKCHILPEF